MKQSNKVKTPIVFRIAIVLFCAMLCSLYLVSGLYARYSATATASDSARVATFSFKDDLSTQTQILPTTFSPGESLITKITIQNDGDVTLKYTVTVENLTKNLPIEDQVIHSDEIVYDTESTFSWSIEWPKENNSIEYMGKMDILRLTVTVEQVD